MTIPTNKRKSRFPINRRFINIGRKRSAPARRDDISSQPRSSDRVSRRDTSGFSRPSPSHHSGNQHRERLRLPFENRRRKGDAGAWVFQHRVGLLVTIVIYLIASILFVSYRIVIYENPSTVIYVDLVSPDEIEPEKLEETPKPVEKITSGHYEQVMNRSSDENAKMNASLKDDRGTRSEELYEEAQRVQREMAAGRKAYEDGMDEIADMSKRRETQQNSSSSSRSTSSNRETTKVQGNVTVSYNLAGRTATYLYMPAYECREGGTVIVGITVNRSGEVTNAYVEKSSSSADGCISTRAVQAALASEFNTDGDAPNRQRGTITYIFVAQ